MSDVQWPDPAEEPEEEPGEDPETHLFPNDRRLRLLTPEQREELVDAVQDWVGDLVERFRERVAALREERQ